MPSLIVQVYKIKNSIEEDITDKCLPILLDDSIALIKEKLLISELVLIPNLVKLQVKIDDSYITIKDSTALLCQYFKVLPENPTIYITYVGDIIEEWISNRRNNVISRIYTDKNLITDKFKQLKQEFTDLQEDDLNLVINTCANNIQLPDVVEMDTSYYVSNMNNEIDKTYKKLSEYENDQNLQTFFQSAKNFNSEIEEIVYNDISLVIKGDNVVSGTKGIFIKLNEIFNIIELNEDIPFIALGKKSSNVKLGQPQIKVLNNILNSVPDKEIKSWVLNEKKKLNEASYKIIKGLMLKVKVAELSSYLTMNILSNGLIYINLMMNKPFSNLDDIINIIKETVNKVIDYINTFKTVFLYSKRLVNLNNSKVVIDSIDATIETTRLIDRNKFDSIAKTLSISKNLVEIKKTDSPDVLSAYYKKFKAKSTSDDIKGITINIRDNPYKKDSSIIKIYSAQNQNQAFIIGWVVLLLAEVSESNTYGNFFEVLQKKRKIREKTNKKKLKEQGINFSSRECQAHRQPSLNVNNEQPIAEDGYNTTYNGKNYKCNNPEYPYPGFTTKNNVLCCYSHNQTGHENYIKNVDPNSLDILVEPSNFKIQVKTNGKTFETFVIKIVSDFPNMNENVDLDNLPKYYYLEPNKNKLTSSNGIIPINDDKIIKIIEDEQNIWLDRVPLSQIIYPSASNKCSNKPDLNNRSKLNAPCAIHKKHKYFGYTSKSIPCCFDKEKDQYITRKKKEADITKQYIIKSAEKILNYKQLGILTPDLNKLFNEIMKSNDGTYYRMGIIQNNSSFLNVLLMACNNIIRGDTINNHSEFKKYIANYLFKNQMEFTKLNNGDISNKYGNVENYIQYINNKDVFLNWLEVIDLLERILKKNILVLDVTTNTKLLCRASQLNPKKFNKPFIVLIKRKNTFEVIVKLSIIDEKNEIIKEFSIENKIIKFFTDYYKDTCVKKNVYPENFKFISLPHYSLYINKLKKDTSDSTPIGNIKYQIKNDFNKVNMLMTKRGLLLPILETGIIDNPEIKVVSFNSLINQQDKLLRLKDYVNGFKALNKLLKLDEKSKIKIHGLLDSNISGIGGIITNQHYTIPYKKSSSDLSQFPQLHKFDYMYYLDADSQLHSDRPKDTVLSLFSREQDSIASRVFQLKKMIGEKIVNSQKVKDDIDYVIVNTEMEKGDKITYLLDIFYEIGIPQNDEALLKAVANEILNDNKEQLILNNIITSDTFNKNDVIIRTSESILLNLDDIRKWVKKYNQLE